MALTVVLVVLGSAGVASALTEDVQVIVTAPLGPYRVGDLVPVTVYTYHQGVLADPANVTLGVDEHPNPPRLVNATRTGQGTFTASVEILASDLSDYSGYPGYQLLMIFANATIANVTDEAYLYISVVPPAPPALEVSIAASPAEVAPGGVVNVTATVRAHGVPQDANAIEITVSSSQPRVLEPLGVHYVGPGSYRAAYSVPADLRGWATLYISADAEVGTEVAYNSTIVRVRPPTPFVVWYSLAHANETRYDLVLHVANETGWPVAGADVNLTYGLDCYPSCSIYGSDDATTDAFGAAPLAVLHPTLPLDPWELAVPFQANVSKDGAWQTVNGFAFAPSPYPFSLSGVALEGVPRTYLPGERVFVNFTVTYWGAAGQPASFYAYTPDRVLAAGATYIDASSHIGFNFIMPAGPVAMTVSANLSGYWIEGHGAVLPTNTTAIHAGPVRIGDTVPITVSLPGRSAVGAMVAFLPYDPTEVDLLSSSSWYPLGGGGLYWYETASSGSTLTYNLTLPRFLPKDQTYILIVQTGGVGFGRYGSADPVYTQIVTLSNQLPVAAASLSRSDVIPGEAVSLDASRSSDADGLIAAYGVDWGDGTRTPWTPNATADHAYGAPGLYVVTVRVSDDSGATNSTSYALRVESTVLGIRSSVFWPVLGISAVALAAVAVFVLQRRRRKATGAPPPNGP